MQARVRPTAAIVASNPRRAPGPDAVTEFVSLLDKIGDPDRVGVQLIESRLASLHPQERAAEDSESDVEVIEDTSLSGQVVYHL